MPKLDAIGLVVSSMGDAIEFYRHLGFEFPEGSESESHAEAAGPGGLRIMFDTEASVQEFSDWQAPAGGGQRLALAFLCEEPAEVDRLYQHLLGLGGRGVMPPFDAFWGQRYATVADLDGNRFDLFAWQRGATT